MADFSPAAPLATPAPMPDDRWRQTPLGRLMGSALRRFDARVLQLMARNVDCLLYTSRCV